MKEDNFKNFVNENREAFDRHKENYEEIWENISDSLDKKQRKSSFAIFRKIAAAVLLLIVAGVIFMKYGNSDRENMAGKNKLPQEIIEARFYYEQMINEKFEAVQANAGEIDPSIFSDLEALDNAYQELVLDLEDNADNEEVIAAMIQNYKIKLEILESILEQLNNGDEDDKADENERSI